MPLRIGTRASALARAQAEWVGRQLIQRGIAVELVPMATTGDFYQSASVSGLGPPGIFTKAVQQALCDGHVDVAVHSLKDLPTDAVQEIRLAAVPERESACDVLISRAGETLEALPQGATIGTGSIRRRAQLLHARGDLQMRGLRGNVDTRLRKVEEGEYDAIVLAAAGLTRLNLRHRITEVLSMEKMLPAPGQGALGIEARADDDRTLSLLAPLDHQPTRQAVNAERALLAAIQGGCRAPVGAWGRIEQGQLHLVATVLSHDGTQRIEARASGVPDDAQRIGRQLAQDLLARGAAELLRAAREHHESD